jgi:hypothetical protein
MTAVHHRIGQGLMSCQSNLQTLLFGNLQLCQGLGYGISDSGYAIGLGRHAEVEQLRQAALVGTNAGVGRHKLRFTADWMMWIGNSSERLHCSRIIVENLEQVENPDQAQGLQREFGGLYQLDVSAALLGRGQKAHQQTDSAGIDHGHLGEIYDDASVSAADCLLHDLAQIVHGGTDPERSPKLDYLHLRVLPNIDVQAFLLSVPA